MVTLLCLDALLIMLVRRYGELSQDENLVYSIIDNAGSTGIWTKTVKQRLNIHAKVSERCFKTLESKGLITPMKNVKFPSRKMYIVAGLQPSEDATGGAWFTDGALDESLLDIVGNVIEKRVSERSWVEVDSTNPGDERGSSPTSKRKAPDDGFDIKGKGKSKVSRVSGDDVSHLDDDNHTPRPDATKTRSKPPTPMKKSYVPHPPGYRGYPDIRWITNEVNNSRIIHSLLPQTALAQLVDVLVYDDRLVRLNIPAEVSHEHKTVYKAVKNIGQIRDQALLKNRQLDPKEDVRKAALREEELQILGPGGMTELPCARCPVFHLCEIGGPASVENCTYFDDWFKKLEALEVLKVKDGEIL